MYVKAHLLPTHAQATALYMTLSKEALKRWRVRWQHGLLEARVDGQPIIVSERLWHIAEINRILRLHTPPVSKHKGTLVSNVKSSFMSHGGSFMSHGG